MEARLNVVDLANLTNFAYLAQSTDIALAYILLLLLLLHRIVFVVFPLELFQAHWNVVIIKYIQPCEWIDDRLARRRRDVVVAYWRGAGLHRRSEWGVAIYNPVLEFAVPAAMVARAGVRLEVLVLYLLLRLGFFLPHIEQILLLVCDILLGLVGDILNLLRAVKSSASRKVYLGLRRVLVDPLIEVVDLGRPLVLLMTINNLLPAVG